MPGKRQNFLATWISLSLIYKNPVQKKNATSQQRVHENKKKDAQSCALELKPPPFNLKNNIAHRVPLIVGITFSRECAYSHNC